MACIKRSKDRAYGSNKVNNLENTDRPALMSFVAEAVRQFFIFEKSKGRFRLKDWHQISSFADDTLSRWEDLFSIEFTEARLLKHGQRKLSWEIEKQEIVVMEQ